MRINRYVASASGLSRRKADQLVTDGRVKIDELLAKTAQNVEPGQKVTLDDKLLAMPQLSTTIILNKPVGYIVSRNGQGSPTIYSLLPKEYQTLKPIGRLDKDSSGLILLTNDGQLIQSLSHPSFNKKKIYQVTLDKNITTDDQASVVSGINLEDGLSSLDILSVSNNQLTISMSEGRNRQIRRTFAALNYKVTTLNRTTFGQYSLDNLRLGEYQEVKS